MAKSAKNIMIDSVRKEVKTRLAERGFKLIIKSSRKFWAVKKVTRREISSVVEEISTLLEVADLDGGVVRPVLKFSYALLNETKDGAAGISIEI